MKAKELMIGDWVYFQNDPFRVANLSSKPHGDMYPIEIDRPAEGDSVTFLFEDDVEPIPLTDEFFEKNGFEIDVDIVGAFWVSKDKRIIVRKGFSNMAGRDWAIHIDNEDMQTIASGCIQFVHQFQNKLNDAEIEMEVVL